MRLLANENIPRTSILNLRASGHEVYAISEHTPGITDADVLRTAHEQQLVIITFDRDYGELIFRHEHPTPAGVLYLRFTPQKPNETAEFIQSLLAQDIKLEGYFSTADHKHVRQRPLRQ